MIAAPLGGIVLLFLVQARELLAQFLGKEENRSRIVDLLNQLTDWLSQAAMAFGGGTVNVSELLRDTLRKIGLAIYERLPDVVGLGGRVLLGALVLYVVLFMLLLRGHQLVDLMVELSPLGARHNRRILSRLEATINGVFLGSLATAVAQGSLGALGSWLLGFENNVVFGVLLAAAGVVPVVGTGIIWVPAALSLWISGHPGTALGMVVLGGIVASVDNLIKPLLIHERAQVHPALVFIGLLGGARIFGAMGLIYGPLLVACLTELIRIYRDEFLITPASGEPVRPTAPAEPSASGD